MITKMLIDDGELPEHLRPIAPETGSRLISFASRDPIGVAGGVPVLVQVQRVIAGLGGIWLPMGRDLTLRLTADRPGELATDTRVVIGADDITRARAALESSKN